MKKARRNKNRKKDSNRIPKIIFNASFYYNILSSSLVFFIIVSQSAFSDNGAPWSSKSKMPDFFREYNIKHMTNLVNHPKSHAHQELAVLHCKQIMRRLGELCKHKLSWVELLNVCCVKIRTYEVNLHLFFT